ncbi:MAG: DEAD/DEAH box helicase, partial [Geminicoccaceae bacterium]
MSIDLELNPSTAHIISFAAIRVDDQEPLVFRRGRIADALRELDRAARSVGYLLGHNFIHFDRVHLEAAGAGPEILKKPIIDTLWLNPLAFPRNPYHHLVKHYQDGRLQGGHVNDPELDARLVFEVLANQIGALSALNQSSPDSLLAFHWLTATRARDVGFDALFSTIRRCRRPGASEAKAAIHRLLEDQACHEQIRNILDAAEQSGWSLAYALAWISVAGSDSVMPPWVRHQFPETRSLVRQLRDTPCSDPSCMWCRVQSDPGSLLKQWFGFDNFRQEPADKDGRPLQEAIAAAVMAGENVLGILPTGTGKSVCYQLPALARFHKTGDLTVVISPLVALMADQLAGLQRQGISSCVAINGLLSLPERHHALDQVRLG